MPSTKNIAVAVLMLVIVLGAIACGPGEPEATQIVVEVTSTPSPTPPATATPEPTATPQPTATPYPTYTPAPTATPQPTYTPYPTYTPEPTDTPQPTPTSEWVATGHWFRDREYELTLNAALAARGYDHETYVATLDSDPNSLASKVSLSLACILETRVMYLQPYSFLVPQDVDTYTVGIWDDATETFVAGAAHTYSDPVLTDDGSAIYIPNNAQINQIMAVIKKADQNQNPNRTLNAGMFTLSSDDDLSFWGVFDVMGLDDALRYLGCF